MQSRRNLIIDLTDEDERPKVDVQVDKCEFLSDICLVSSFSSIVAQGAEKILLRHSKAELTMSIETSSASFLGGGELSGTNDFVLSHPFITQLLTKFLIYRGMMGFWECWPRKIESEHFCCFRSWRVAQGSSFCF